MLSAYRYEQIVVILDKNHRSLCSLIESSNDSWWQFHAPNLQLLASNSDTSEERTLTVSYSEVVDQFHP